MSDDPLLPRIGILILLLLIYAFFTASELAILSLSVSDLKKHREENDRLTARLLKMLQTPERLRLTSHICITLSGFLAAAYTADAFARPLVSWLTQTAGITLLSPNFLRRLTVLALSLLLSCLFLIIGEQVPRRLAVKKSERIIKISSGVLYWTSLILRPLSWLLNQITRGLLRLMDIEAITEGAKVSEDEIMKMVDLGEERGAIESNEKELIENIFEFNNTTAGDIMVHRTDMVMLPVDSSVSDILQTIRESGLSRFPVYDENPDDIIGILNTRDFLLNTQLTHPKPVRALLRSAYFVPELVRSDVLFRDMQSRKVHMSIVVDEYGGASGLVTMEDLLEEIVGNIYDEFDPLEAKAIEQVGDNLWLVSGSAELDCLGAELGIEFDEDEESDTLGGLVFAQLSVIPEDGSRFEVDACGLHIQVTELADRRVEQALVSKLPQESGDDSSSPN